MAIQRFEGLNARPLNEEPTRMAEKSRRSESRLSYTERRRAEKGQETQKGRPVCKVNTTYETTITSRAASNCAGGTGQFVGNNCDGSNSPFGW